MICPNLRIGSPSPTGAAAILWPFGTRSRARTPAVGSEPAENLVDGDDHIVRGVEAQSARRGHDCRLSDSKSVGRKKFRLPPCEIFEPRGGDREMLLHRFARRRGILGLDRTRDRGVLVERRTKLSWRRHSQPARSFQMDAQRLENVVGARHASGERSISGGTPRRARRTSLRSSSAAAVGLLA